MEMEFYIKHLVHFRTTQICKSKEEYIRKFDKGAVFGYFAQGVFQLEHYEDWEIIAPVNAAFVEIVQNENNVWRLGYTIVIHPPVLTITHYYRHRRASTLNSVFICSNQKYIV